MTIFDDIKRDRKADRSACDFCGETHLPLRVLDYGGWQKDQLTCSNCYKSDDGQPDFDDLQAFEKPELRRISAGRVVKLEVIALAAGKLAKAADQHGWHCNDIEFHDELLELLEICK